MISMKINDKQLLKDLNNLVQYSVGFLDGAQAAKPKLMAHFGESIKEMIGDFIDSNARVDPSSLHHVYEWYQVGNPASRLFDIQYVVSGKGLSINGTLTQSSSVQRGSNTPFYSKAKIMESGVPVTIAPKNSNVLRFESNGETVFTKKPVQVNNPGGDNVVGSFENTFRSFFVTYGSQAILEMSGLGAALKTPTEFKKNFVAGVKTGRAVGLKAGTNFISGGIR